MSGLNPEQIRLFRHNGFLKMPGRLSTETVERVRAAILQDMEREAEPVVRDADGKVVRLSQVLDRDPLFLEVASSDVVLHLLQSLLGPNIEVVRNRHNHATLNLASRNSDYLHRDVRQWSRPLVTVIFYLEETTIENGCTVMIPGSHLLPGLPVLHGIEKQDWVEKSGIVDQGVPVPMPAGGMVVIDSLIFHRIGTNHTDGSRMSVTFGYRSVDELAGVEDPKALLIRGERVYSGNDQY